MSSRDLESWETSTSRDNMDLLRFHQHHLHYHDHDQHQNHSDDWPPGWEQGGCLRRCEKGERAELQRGEDQGRVGKCLQRQRPKRLWLSGQVRLMSLHLGFGCLIKMYVHCWRGGGIKKTLTLADVMCVHCTLYRPNWYLYFRVSDGRYRRTNYRIIVRNLSSRTSWQVPFILVTSLINHYICVCSPVHLLSVQNITFTFSTALCWWCTPVVHVCPLGPLGFLFLGPPEHRLALLQSQKSISVLTSISPSCINLASLTTRSNWKVRQKIEDNPHQGN